jgi:hypothetical protein
MHEYEHKNLKENLQRLEKIDEACEKDILEKYLKAEIDMYNASKSFVQMFEARSKCKENRHCTKRSLNTVDNVRKRAILQQEAEKEDCDY